MEVSNFPAQRYFYDYYQQGILHKLVFRAGLSGILKKINGWFKSAVEKFKPDVIWVFKGMEIFPGSLRWAKNKGIKLVNFNGDSPFIFSGKGSGNAYVTDSISLYDLHLTYNRAVQKEMTDRYNIPTSILPFGYDIDEALYLDCCREDEVVKVCFLGNPDEYRGAFLQQLAEAGVKLDLYGNNWDKFVQHENVSSFAPVYADECWRTLRKYRVQLNLMRPHNPDTHNMRSFELGGVGAIQLAADTPDHRNYFTAGKEIFLFENMEECIHQINHLLSMDKKMADQIRMDTRNRSLESGYSYRDRSMQALQEINKLFA